MNLTNISKKRSMSNLEAYPKRTPSPTKKQRSRLTNDICKNIFTTSPNGSKYTQGLPDVKRSLIASGGQKDIRELTPDLVIVSSREEKPLQYQKSEFGPIKFSPGKTRFIAKRANGDGTDLLNRTIQEKLEIAITITGQVIKYHRDSKKVHRDIKLKNILYIFLPNRIIIELIDFDLSKQINEQTRFSGTSDNIPPELYKIWNSRETIQVHKNQDSWGLGTTLLHLITKRRFTDLLMTHNLSHPNIPKTISTINNYLKHCYTQNTPPPNHSQNESINTTSIKSELTKTISIDSQDLQTMISQSIIQEEVLQETFFDQKKAGFFVWIKSNILSTLYTGKDLEIANHIVDLISDCLEYQPINRLQLPRLITKLTNLKPTTPLD